MDDQSISSCQDAPAAHLLWQCADLDSCPIALQDKACSTASVDVIRRALLQQTSTWDEGKRSALERFFERPRAAATGAVTPADHTQTNAAAATAATGTVPPAATMYDFMRPPASAVPSVRRQAEGSGPLRHATPASRFQPYGRPANRTGASHLNR
jgi:hypothetical protein